MTFRPSVHWERLDNNCAPFNPHLEAPSRRNYYFFRVPDILSFYTTPNLWHSAYWFSLCGQLNIIGPFQPPPRSAFEAEWTFSCSRGSQLSYDTKFVTFRPSVHWERLDNNCAPFNPHQRLRGGINFFVLQRFFAFIRHQICLIPTIGSLGTVR